MANEDILKGRFVNGRAEGIMTYTFFHCGITRYAEYHLGHLVKWLDDEKADIVVSALNWLTKESRFNSEIRKSVEDLI